MAFEGLTEKLTNAFKKLRGKGRLTESDVKEAMREIRMALLEADVSYKVVKDFVARVSERAVGSDVLESLTPAQMIVKIVNEELTALMGGEEAKLNLSSKSPTIVMMVGLQGAGKTTNSAKLAGLMKKQGKRPLLVACDVYRPAAIEQLEVVGKQLDIPVFQMGQISPVDIAKAAIEHAKKHGNDLVFLDTAGRLHIDAALMEELQNIKNTVSPDEILLVVDAMIGQDAVNAAKAFDEALDITGVMLTKLDGDARGGAVQLCQDNAIYAKLAVKALRNRYSVLTRHCVYDQQNFLRLDCRFDILQFLHEFLIDMQTACRIDQNYIVMLFRSIFQRLFGNFHRAELIAHLEHRNIVVFPYHL